MGATVPFISRYRKEATGGLDETAIRSVETEIRRLEQLEQRRDTITDTIREQGKLTDDVTSKINEAAAQVAGQF